MGYTMGKVASHFHRQDQYSAKKETANTRSWVSSALYGWRGCVEVIRYAHLMMVKASCHMSNTQRTREKPLRQHERSASSPTHQHDQEAMLPAAHELPNLASDAPPVRPRHVLTLQRAFGNQWVQRWLQRETTPEIQRDSGEFRIDDDPKVYVKPDLDRYEVVVPDLNNFVAIMEGDNEIAASAIRWDGNVAIVEGSVPNPNFPVRVKYRTAPAGETTQQAATSGGVGGAGSAGESETQQAATSTTGGVSSGPAGESATEPATTSPPAGGSAGPTAGTETEPAATSGDSSTSNAPSPAPKSPEEKLGAAIGDEIAQEGDQQQETKPEELTPEKVMAAAEQKGVLGGSTNLTKGRLGKMSKQELETVKRWIDSGMTRQEIDDAIGSQMPGTY